MTNEMNTTTSEAANVQPPAGNPSAPFFRERIEMKLPHRMPARPVVRHGFTLVEIMVVVVIIGILLSLVVPATMRAIQRAKETAQKMEVSALSDAVDQYQQRWNDYPPDGSDLPVLQRHMRKVFPRMSNVDQALLEQLTHPNGTFSPVAIDRGEALVFFLGGFSEDVQQPLRGEGGPIKLVTGADATDPAVIGNIANYEYNATRDNALFDFDPSRLTTGRLDRSNPNEPPRPDDSNYLARPLLSTDEQLLGQVTSNHGALDPLPAYKATAKNPTPILYFDSRSYADAINEYRTGNPEFGGVRPYMTNSTSGAAGIADAQFHNRDTFQIVSPGSDGVYGNVTSDGGGNPVFFVTESGDAVGPGTPPNISGLQDRSGAIRINGHLDNITNFSTSTLESDLP